MNGLILDPAHGKNVKGKCSPNGEHKEYLWSRYQIRDLMRNSIYDKNCPYIPDIPFLDYENEPGLTDRVKMYNSRCKQYDNCLVLSLHNDANPKSICDNEGFGQGHGIAFWTSKGETKADRYAEFMYTEFKKLMPKEHFRTAYWLSEKEIIKDVDYEADFTILAGNNHIEPRYEAILIEVLFQNNREDLKKLLNSDWNNMFNNALRMVLYKLFKNINLI
jgi:N-acetylmuramoyl-L-alanine amidase